MPSIPREDLHSVATVQGKADHAGCDQTTPNHVCFSFFGRGLSQRIFVVIVKSLLFLFACLVKGLAQGYCCTSGC